MASRSSHVLECSSCIGALTGRKYVRHDSKPFCIPCFERDIANRCVNCEKLISVDQKEVSFKDKFYHDVCFSCINCKSSLIEKPFAYKNNTLTCMICYENMPNSKCHSCGAGFKNGQVTMEFAGKHWHEECFRCKHCQCIISTDRFVEHDDGQLCISCFDRYFASRCFKCNKVITTGGMRVGSTPWHSECFVCQKCNSSLSSSPFLLKGCNYYCDSCYKEHFVKKCMQCNKPITGADDPRCISFDGKTWHNGCFICCHCKRNLNEKGFIMSINDKLMCPLCAKKYNKDLL